MIKKFNKLKKGIALVCLVTLSSTACSDNNPNEEKVDSILESVDNNETEVSNNFGISNEWDGKNYGEVYSNFAESTDGFYYVDYSAATAGKLYYLSKKDGSIVPFCTKVECEHKLPNSIQTNEGDEIYQFECEAAFYLNQDVQVYDGKLYIDRRYVNSDDFTLECWNLDGSEKKVLIQDIGKRTKERQAELTPVGISGFKYSLTWRIHNGKIYIISAIEENGEYGAYFYIDEYDLETGEFIKGLYEEKIHRNNLMVNSMYTYDNRIMLEMNVSIPQSDEGQCFLTTREYFLFDIDKQELKQIPVEDRYYATLMEDKVLYQKNGQDVYSVDENGVETLCIELEEKEKTGCGVVPKYIGDYIFITPYFDDLENTEGIQFYTKIYDKNFNLIDTVNLPNYLAVTAGHNQIIWRAMSFIVYYINVDEIGTGKIELKKYERQ